MSGFVSFAGSGASDPERLTLKAVCRVKAADVLFDDLSADPMLSHVRALRTAGISFEMIPGAGWPG